MQRFTLEEFKKIHLEWKKSGLSIQDFCANTGIKESRFYYWKKRVEAGVNLPGATSCHSALIKLAYVHTQRFLYVLPLPLSYGYEKELLFPKPASSRMRCARTSSKGDAFIFVNRSLTRMKILYIEFDGLVIYNIKLEQGRILGYSFDVVVDC